MKIGKIFGESVVTGMGLGVGAALIAGAITAARRAAEKSEVVPQAVVQTFSTSDPQRAALPSEQVTDVDFRAIYHPPPATSYDRGGSGATVPHRNRAGARRHAAHFRV